MDLIQKASKLGYKHYTECTVGELDKLPISNNSKQIEYCFLQKWLREVHNIIISINFNHDIKQYCNSIEDTYYYEFYYDWYNTYEEALEVGLQEALKLIP